MNLSAVFTAVGNFTGLTRPAKDAADALENVKKKAGEIDSSMPSNGGKAGDGLKAIGTRAGELGDQMAGVGSSMTKGVTLPIVAGLTTAGKQFQDFEITIVQAGQKAGATAEQMDRMKQKAIEMGATTAFSASEAAGGLDILAAGGMNAEDAMVALEGVMLGAQASGEGLELTAGVVASAINAFGLEAKDAAAVSDVLAQSANTTALDMQDLAMVMANAGEVGPRFGQSLESVVAWAGRLKDMGVPAASAGTAIRQALVSLSAPSNKAAGYMEDLGIKIRDAEGKMLPIPELVSQFGMAFDETNPKFKEAAEAAGVSGQEFKDMAMKAMFGAEGAKAMSLAISDGKPVLIDVASEAKKMQQLQDGLAKTMGKDGAEAWIKARTEMGVFTGNGADAVTALTALGEASAGTAAEVGAVMAETQAMKWDEMMGSIETMAIELGTVMAPAVKDVMAQVTEAVNKFTEWGKKNPEMVQLGLKIALVAAALGPLLVGAGKMIKLFGAISKGVGGAINGVQKFGNGLKWAFGKGPEGQASRFVRSFDSIRLRAGQAKDAVVAGGKKMGSAMKTAGTAVVNGAKTVATGFANIVAATGRAIAAGARWAAQMVAQAARATAAFVAQVARQVAAWVVLGAQSLLHAAKVAAAWLIAMGPIAIVIAAVVGLAVLIYKNWDKIKQWTKAAWDWILAALKTAWEWIKTAITTYFTMYFKIISTVWSMIRDAAIAVWDGIKDALKTAWEWIKKTASSLWENIKKAITDKWDALKSAIDTGITKLKTALSNAWDAIKSTASSLWENVKKAITDKWNALKGAIDTGISNLKTGLSNAWTNIKNTAYTAWDNVKSTIMGRWNDLKTKFDTAITNLKTALSNAWGSIRDTAERMWGQVRDKIKAPIRVVLDTVVNKGLIRGYNFLAGKVGAKKIDEINIGFRQGGYTGNISPSKVAGVVHGDEQVIKSPSRRKFERENPGVLDYINERGELPVQQEHGPALPQYRAARLPQGDFLESAKNWFSGKISALTDLGKHLLDGVPDLGNNMVGDMLRSAVAKMKNAVLDKVKRLFGFGPGEDGSVTAAPNGSGPGGVGMGWRAMKSWIERQRGLGARVTSAFRPGAITATGFKSLHGLGRAIDIVGPNMRAIFARIVQAYGVGKIKQLIYSPMKALNIHEGRRYHPSAITMRGHWDHVHWGMQSGGLVPGMGTGDKTPIMGEPGEYMIRKPIVRKVGVQALQALNEGRAQIVLENMDLGQVLRSREAAAVASARRMASVKANAMAGVGAGATYIDNSQHSLSITVNNPIAERASDSIPRRLTRAAQLGIIGARRSDDK